MAFGFRTLWQPGKSDAPRAVTKSRRALTLSEAQAPHSLSGWLLLPFQRDQLVAGRDLSRQDAEFVGVPITDEHLDRGQHFLTAAPSLGMTSLLG